MQKVLNQYDLSPQELQENAQTDKLVDKKLFLKHAVNKLRMIIRPNVRIVPAALAVVIQCAALLTVAAITLVVDISTTAYFKVNLSVSLFILVLMQALLATTFSYIARMESWWRWIHLCFPLTAWAMF